MASSHTSSSYNAQFEQAQVEEASYQFIALLDQAFSLLRLEQGILLLDLGYDEEGRQDLCRTLAQNLLHTGVQGLSKEALHEAVGEVLLTELIYRSAYEQYSYQESCLLLQRSPEFRNYVREHPPVTISTRRDRPSTIRATRSERPDGQNEGLDDGLPEVPAAQRIYYHRGVSHRPGRTAGRTRWRDDRAMRQP